MVDSQPITIVFFTIFSLSYFFRVLLVGPQVLSQQATTG